MLVLWILFLLAMSGLGLVFFALFSNKKAEDLLPPAGKFVQLGNTHLHYVDQGQGPAAGQTGRRLRGGAQPAVQQPELADRDRRAADVPGPGFAWWRAFHAAGRHGRGADQAGRIVDR